MSDKTFTLEEANSLLPVLESLLQRAIDTKLSVAVLDQEFQDLSRRIFLMGGIRINVTVWGQRKTLREEAIQQIKDCVNEIQATGVQVKDLDLGLLDFPTLVDGEIVLLCWKLGEPHNIAHWHGTQEGFAERKSIDLLNLGQRPNSEKPN